jgi:Xaa-Pro aminopeptidase
LESYSSKYSNMIYREILSRRERLRKILEDKGLCKAVIMDSSTIFYFTGYKGQGLYYQDLEAERLYVPLMEYWKAVEDAGSMVPI